ncbi:MAG TPA: YncE family protein [Candidatus Acidoferrales bacterium]|nr:YncE family protein [Candidatus Acidoferrales bacterium]
MLAKRMCNATAALAAMMAFGFHVAAQSTPTPARALLVLEKDTTQLDIVDPNSLKIIAKVPVGPDPHEVIASADGKAAYVSDYMGRGGMHHILTVIDLVAQKPLAPIDLGALEAPHGLDFIGGELYFTAEGAKAIGRYNPATSKIDWIMGTGEDRTHMVWVSNDLAKIVTSNVASGTVSIIEQVTQTGPPGRGSQKNWEVKDVPAGHGSEGFDVSPDEKEIWTANAQDNTATVIDFAAKKDITTLPISVRGANRLKFTPDGKYVLISGLGGGPGSAGSSPNLVVIDAATRKEVKQLNLGGGSAGILIDPVGNRAFVAVSGGNKVAVVNLKDFSVTGYIAPLAQPDGMAWAVRQ